VTITHPPQPLTTVLDRVLRLMQESGRYESVENGRVEIAWIQKRQCYQITLDFLERESGR
jgi:hypothetical protein